MTSIQTELIQVEQGIYELKYLAHETFHAFKAGKLRVDFKIISFGPEFGKVVSRFYNVKLKGPAKTRGRFAAGWQSECMREYVNLLNERPERNDRLNWSKLKDKIVVGAVRDVDVDYKQRSKHALLRNSVVGELVGLKE